MARHPADLKVNLAIGFSRQLIDPNIILLAAVHRADRIVRIVDGLIADDTAQQRVQDPGA